MKKHIAEELPARKFPQASLSKGGGDTNREGGDKDRQGGEGGEKTPEKRVRQAVYDIKYRARRENIPLRAAYTQYMQNSSMSEQEKSMVREKLFGKGGIVKETYLQGIPELASSSVAKALYNVFVEKKSEVVDYNQLKDELEESSHNSGERKYKVRVTDKNGTSYVRYANREKINSLRANPNIESVEMTEYGEPYEGEARGGKQTAAAKAGKDYDGDGKVESGAKEYRGAVHNAIQRKKGGVPDGKDTSSVKEEFLGELTDERTIDVKGGKKKPNKITVHHKNHDDMTESSYSKFLGLLSEKKMTSSEKKKEKKLKKKYDDSGMKASMKKQYGSKKGENVYFATIRKQAMKEESCGSDDKTKNDPRQDATKRSLLRTKLGSMGINKAVIMSASYEPEGEMVDEASAAARRGVAEPHRGDVGGRREKAKASLAAAKKGGETRRKGAERSAQSGNPEIAQRLLTAKSKPEQEHAERFPGSRQKPKPKPVSGTKETPEGKEVAEKEERERISASNRRPPTQRQKKETKAREPYYSTRD